MSTLGLDRSGNGNDWIAVNITIDDQVVDSPTNNFATLNPLSENTASALVVSEGNLSVTRASGSWDSIKGTFGVSSGKWYWEVNYVSGLMTDIMTGICDTSIDNKGTNAWVTGSLLWYNHTGGELRVNGSDTTANYGLLTDGDILGIALNMDDKQITFYKNNVALVTNYSIDSNITTATAYTLQDHNAIQVFNFGQDSSFAGNKTAQGNQDGNSIGDFYYTPPTGFLALCTKNLPDVAVTPSEHFNTVIYSGSGSAQSITGVGFAPDFSWFKSRSNSDYHNVYDSVRGGIKYLLTDLTEAEQTAANGFVSLDSDGFSLDNAGSGGEVNGSGKTYVAWNWKANGSGSANTAGSIDATVSANIDAGFSIINWTKEGSSGTKTVGHGLSKAPEIIIFKEVDDPSHWSTYVGVGGSTTRGLLYLNLTAAQTTNDANQWSDTAPTSTVFTYNQQYSFGNNNDKEMIGYAFHSVDGYSKVGSYTGNGNADGVFVYTGFRPAYVMYKRTDSTAHWQIYDAKRDIDNVTETSLYANLSNAELGGYALDMLSNGFKQRESGAGQNADGGKYIYLAFAETPFKYSNAR